ncbi:MAG: DUF4160 domain-containing protein [Protaetiibacter sp.]
MPTVAREGPYRLFFYSNENAEPPHVHVERGRGRITAKFWIAPVRLARTGGMRPVELSAVAAIVRRRERQIEEAWHGHFGG